MLALGNGTLELGDVTRDDVGIQSEVLRADDDILGAEIAAYGIERFGERRARAFVVGVGPEERDDLVARHAAFARAREQCEDREAPGLSGCTAHRTGVSKDGQAA
jgi:hypothetical protein